MNRLNKKYIEEVIPALREKAGYKNNLAVPRIVKVVLNSGIGRYIKDDKIIGGIVKDMELISGQKPALTQAKKSIANFKTRTGMKIGVKVTLRGKRMYDFLDRLISIALPRSKDFRGINESSIDKTGNLTIGIKEHIIFPEISKDDVSKIFGLEITIVSTARTREEAAALYKELGFPIKKEI